MIPNEHLPTAFRHLLDGEPGVKKLPDQILNTIGMWLVSKGLTHFQCYTRDDAQAFGTQLNAKPLQKQLAAEGLGVWGESDAEFRVADWSLPKSGNAAVERVLRSPSNGTVCAHCGILEPSRLKNLIVGSDGKHVHTKCAPIREQWLQTAVQFKADQELTQTDRYESLLSALEQLAHREVGQKLPQWEFHAQMLGFLEGDPRQHWSHNLPHLKGLLMHDLSLHSELRERHVDVWLGSDGVVRIVDRRPPVSNEQAVERRSRAQKPGKVCRFCDIEESHDVEMLRIDGGFLHERCRLSWYAWQPKEVA